MKPEYAANKSNSIGIDVYTQDDGWIRSCYELVKDPKRFRFIEKLKSRILEPKDEARDSRKKIEALQVYERKRVTLHQ